MTAFELAGKNRPRYKRPASLRSLDILLGVGYAPPVFKQHLDAESFKLVGNERGTRKAFASVGETVLADPCEGGGWRGFVMSRFPRVDMGVFPSLAALAEAANAR